MPLLSNGPGTIVLGADDRAAAVAAVKARLRVVSADEDALIAAMAETALGLCERVIGQAVIARAMVQPLALFGGWQLLAARPVRSIDTVTDAAGAALAVGDYAIDVDGDGLGWVRVAAESIGGAPARARFTAGIADDWDALPPGLREGAAMLAAHLFDDRTGAAPVPAAVTALWRPFRVIRLGLESRRELGA